MTFVGPCVLDVVQHFVERWNEIKHRKVCRVLIFTWSFTHYVGAVYKGRVSLAILLISGRPIAYPQSL